MISLWPLRSGVLVDGGVAYFTAGLFPNERVFFYAVDAETGKLLWKNDTKGESAFEQISFSPQGYLLASETAIYTPLGRVPPAAFDRKTGQFKFYTSFGKTVGGTYALLADDEVYTGTSEIVGFKQESRDRFASFPGGRRMVVDDKTAYLLTDTALVALDRAAQDAKKPKWQVEAPGESALILAGETLFVGGQDVVTAVDAKTGKTVWSGKVTGCAKGLAVSDGKTLRQHRSRYDSRFRFQDGLRGRDDRRRDGPGAVCRYAGESGGRKDGREDPPIVREERIRAGDRLDTGCLAYELAKQSDLVVYAVSDDAEKVRQIRRDARQVALVGLTALRRDLAGQPRFPIPTISRTCSSPKRPSFGAQGNVPEHLYRMLKPVGGVLVLAKSPKR